MRRAARVFAWFAGITAFLFLSAYAVGGRALLRRLLQVRSRTVAQIQESLQPPTPAEMAAAAARDTASVLAKDKPPSASAAFIVAFVATILVVAVVAFYVSGRRRRAAR